MSFCGPCPNCGQPASCGRPHSEPCAKCQMTVDEALKEITKRHEQVAAHTTVSIGYADCPHCQHPLAEGWSFEDRCPQCNKLPGES